MIPLRLCGYCGEQATIVLVCQPMSQPRRRTCTPARADVLHARVRPVAARRRAHGENDAGIIASAVATVATGHAGRIVAQRSMSGLEPSWDALGIVLGAIASVGEQLVDLLDAHGRPHRCEVANAVRDGQTIPSIGQVHPCHVLHFETAAAEPLSKHLRS